MKTSKTSFAKIAKALAIILTAATTALSLSPVFAASKTVTLSVPSMFCETCPITVKKALNKVKGISKIDISLEKREAVVVFDDTQTNATALTEATKNAGYPSRVVDTPP